MSASREVLSLQSICVATVVQAIRLLNILHPAFTIWVSQLASMPRDVRQDLLTALWIANEQPNQQLIQPTVLLDVTLALISNFVENFNLDWTKSFRASLQERAAVFEKKATRHLLERLSSSSKNSLEYLSLHGCCTWTTLPPDIFHQILSFSNLRHLKMEDFVLGEVEFRMMCTNFKMLRSLDVNISSSVPPENIINCVAGLAYHQNQLERVMMYYFPKLKVVGRRGEFRKLCHSLGDRVVNFPQESSRLENLVLLQPITTQQAQWHSHHATSLEVQLNLDEERWKPLQLLTNIKRLKLAGDCSENTLVSMLQVYGPKLEELSTSSLFSLPCQLQTVFDHCPNQEDLYLVRAAPNLKKIRVKLWRLTRWSIQNNAHVFLQLPQVVPTLEALEVCTEGCDNIIDELLIEVLQHVANGAPRLKSVVLEPKRSQFQFQGV